MDVKTIFGIIAVVLTFVGYAPYITSVLKEKTQPHIYSWLVWLLVDLLIFALQLAGGAGAGSFVALTAGLMSLTVIILAVYKKNKSDITTADTMFLLLALVALAIWLFARQPLLSVILIMTVDVFAFIPTIRKSWLKPYSENASFFAINIVRFCFALAALQEYTIITTLYPAFWLFGNSAFTAMLIFRRKTI